MFKGFVIPVFRLIKVADFSTSEGMSPPLTKVGFCSEIPHLRPGTKFLFQDGLEAASKMLYEA